MMRFADNLTKLSRIQPGDGRIFVRCSAYVRRRVIFLFATLRAQMTTEMAPSARPGAGLLRWIDNRESFTLTFWRGQVKIIASAVSTHSGSSRCVVDLSGSAIREIALDIAPGKGWGQSVRSCGRRRYANGEKIEFTWRFRREQDFALPVCLMANSALCGNLWSAVMTIDVKLNNNAMRCGDIRKLATLRWYPVILSALKYGSPNLASGKNVGRPLGRKRFLMGY